MWLLSASGRPVLGGRGEAKMTAERYGDYIELMFYCQAGSCPWRSMAYRVSMESRGGRSAICGIWGGLHPRRGARMPCGALTSRKLCRGYGNDPRAQTEGDLALQRVEARRAVLGESRRIQCEGNFSAGRRKWPTRGAGLDFLGS